MEISDILNRYPAARLELEVSALVHAVAENRAKLTEILAKYGVTKPEEIEEKIAKKEIPGHPAFEDYLSAVAYQIDSSDLLKRLEEGLRELRA